jgi:hypothetical protein
MIVFSAILLFPLTFKSDKTDKLPLTSRLDPRLTGAEKFELSDTCISPEQILPCVETVPAEYISL